jgi:hypothetical protein
MVTMRLFGAVAFALFSVGVMAQTVLGSLNHSDSGVTVSNDLRRVVGYANGFYTVTKNGGDVLIARYNTLGVQVASARWSAPHGDVTQVFDAKIDTPGNIYVAMGAASINSPQTHYYVKFNALIQVQFERVTNDFFNTQLQLTPGGLGMLVGQRSTGSAVFAFAGNGNALWNSNLTETAQSSGLGLDNSLWIGGHYPTGAASLIKRSYLNGQIQAAWLSTSQNAANEVTAITTDFNGVIYAFGRVVEQSTNYLKLTRWVNGTFSEFRVTNAAGNFTSAQLTGAHVYVGGTGTNTIRVLKSNPAIATTAFSTFPGPFRFDGDTGFLWENAGGTQIRRVNNDFSSPNLRTLTHAVGSITLMGTTGGVVAAGTTANANVARLSKLSPSNTIEWTEDINDTGFARHTPVAQEIGGENDLYDVGYTLDTPTLSRPYLNRVGNNGTLVWSRRLDLSEVTDVAIAGTHVVVSGRNSAGQPVVNGYLRTNGNFVYTRVLTNATDTVGTTVGVVANFDDSFAVFGNFGTPGMLRMKMIVFGATQVETARTTVGPMGEVARQVENDLAGRYFAVAESGSVYAINSTGTQAWQSLVNGRYGKIAVNPNSTELIVACQPNVGGFYPSWEVRTLRRSNGVAVFNDTVTQTDAFVSLDMNPDGRGLISITNPQTSGSSWLLTTVGASESSFSVIPEENRVGRFLGSLSASFGDNTGPLVSTSQVSLSLTTLNTLASKVTTLASPGVGLDSKAYNLLQSYNGTLWSVATMERRGLGRVVLYTRWRLNQEPPIANQDLFNIKKGTSGGNSGLGVLANDGDLNGDAITAELVSPPAQGTFNLNANGSYTYTAPNVTGTFYAVYRCRDATGRVSEARDLIITVTN